jgi:deoxyribodipyrimidine photolyase-like uncharacterized protein
MKWFLFGFLPFWVFAHGHYCHHCWYHYHHRFERCHCPYNTYRWEYSLNSKAVKFENTETVSENQKVPKKGENTPQP